MTEKSGTKPMPFHWLSWLTEPELPPPQTGMTAVHMAAVSKVYVTGAGEFPALHEVNLDVAWGEFVAVIGKSGSGKSTLINMITGIDRPTSGEVWVAGTPVHTLSENQIAVWRGKMVGIVFQFFQLLPMLTILENIMLPMDFCSVHSRQDRPRRALELLAMVGIADQADKLPANLSGGQQQRAAIARSLANDPPLVVADEPTGNLDSQTAGAVIDLFAQLAKSGKTIIMVTHDQDLAGRSSRIVTVTAGQIAPQGV